MRGLFRSALVLFAAVLACSAQSYVIDTIAGTYSVGDGGAAKDALFWSPVALVVDGAGNVFVADYEHHRVRKIATDGTITTVAGTGVSGFSGDGGPAVSAQLSGPQALALDQDGNLYITDRNNLRIRKMSPDGKIMTVAGDGTAGYSGDGQKALSAKLRWPEGLGLDKAGNLYIADTNNHCLRKVTPDGIITTIAGTGTSGFSGDTRAAKDAQLNTPMGNIVFDADGNLYLSDTWNLRVRRITPEGVISTVAGCTDSCSGGSPLRTWLGYPAGLAFDASGDLLIAEWFYGQGVRKLTRGGALSTVAGTGDFGFAGDGGPAGKALLANPRSLGIDGSGAIYFCDSGSHRVRKIAGDTISTFAGRDHFDGDNGPAKGALLFGARNIAYDKNGNMYIADSLNHRVRKVTPSGTITTVAGSSAFGGYSGDGAAAAAARLNWPTGVAVDAEGNLYISDSNNHRIRKVGSDGKIITFAGTGQQAFGGDTGPAKDAFLDHPRGLAFDKSGNLYVADVDNHRVRKITPQGIITTIAGIGGTGGFSGDGALAKGAKLNSPVGVAVDAQGAVYIADYYNGRIRKVDVSGTIDTFVQWGNPENVVVDAAGNVYYSAGPQHRIQRVTPAKVMTTIAGTGAWGFSGDGGFAAAARMWSPIGMAVDPQGNVVFADYNNHRIRRLSLVVPSQVVIVSGNEQTGGISQALSAPLVVKVVSATGLGIPGVRVAFTLPSGQGRLSASSANTGPDGTAGVTLTLGATPGTVTVTATVEGLTPVRFTATALREPKITGVVGAAGSAELIAPGGLVSVFGIAFATGAVKTPGAADLVDGRLPTKFQGTCIQFGGEPVPIVSLGSTQANVQVPPGLAEGEVPVQVIISCGEADEAKSNVVNVVVQSAAPEFFLIRRGTDGRGPIVAMKGSTRIGATSLGSGYVPAKPGDTLTLVCTGLGMTDPPLEFGMALSGPAAITGMASLVIGEIVVPAENITYIGATPRAIGTYQVNVKIPDDVSDGDQTVVLTVNGYSSPPNGYLTIQR